MTVAFNIPVKTKNPTNNREYWRVVWKRSKRERELACAHASARVMRKLKPGERATVSMVRVSRGQLDSDNLRPALKSIRDGIADALGCNDSHNAPIAWLYEQRKGKAPGVDVVIDIQSPEATA